MSNRHFQQYISTDQWVTMHSVQQANYCQTQPCWTYWSLSRWILLHKWSHRSRPVIQWWILLTGFLMCGCITKLCLLSKRHLWWCLTTHSPSWMHYLSPWLTLQRSQHLLESVVKQLVINLQLAQLELISQNTTRTALSDCLACTPSKYCDQTGMSDVVRDCLQGNAHFLTLIIWLFTLKLWHKKTV